jgi:hypothetical protein
MKFLYIFKCVLISLPLVACHSTGVSASHICYTNCGDNRSVVLEELVFVKTVKHKARDSNKVHAISIEFKMKSNFNLKESQLNYSAATFSLRVPMLNEDNLRNSINASILRDGLISSSESGFEYIANISLRRDSNDESYDQAMAVIEKCGGLPLVPTMARMFTGWPSLVKFKPVFLKISKEQVEVKPEEWDSSLLAKNSAAVLPTDFNCNS